MDANEILDELSERVDVHGVASLSENEKVVYLISWADFEICLGGVSGYLYNSAGDGVADLPWAYSVIGCPTVAKRAADLVSHLDSECNVQNRESRWEVLKNPSAELSETMDLFGDAIVEHLDEWGEKFEKFFSSHWP